MSVDALSTFHLQFLSVMLKFFIVNVVTFLVKCISAFFFFLRLLKMRLLSCYVVEMSGPRTSWWSLWGILDMKLCYLRGGIMWFVLTFLFPLLVFHSLALLLRIQPNTELNKSWGCGHPCLSLSLEGMLLFLPPLNTVWPMGLFSSHHCVEVHSSYS